MDHVAKRTRYAFQAVAIAIVLAASVTVMAASVPSIDQVYQTARAGDLQRADEMMQEVLRAYPHSARAHYAYAQILAAEGRIDEGRSQLRQAEQIAPGLPFVSPQALTSLERRLQPGHEPARVKSGGIPWFWILIAGAIVLFLLARRRRNRPYYQGSYGNPSNSPGYGYGGQPYSSGGGWWNWILAGLGFGAGTAAGEYAADRFLNRDRQQQDFRVDDNNNPSNPADNLGGNDFGINSGSDPNSGGWTDSGSDQSTGNDSGDFGMSGGGNDGGWNDSSGGGNGGGWDDSSSGGGGGTDV